MTRGSWLAHLRPMGSRVFYRILGSFILLALTISLVYVLYTYQVSIAEQRRLGESNMHGQLTVLAESLNTQFRECAALALTIQQNSALSQSRLRHDYYGYEGIQSLNSLLGTNQFISDIGILFPGNDTLYTAKGLMSIMANLKYGFNLDDLEIEDYQKALSQMASPTLYPLGSTGKTQYILPLPLNSDLAHVNQYVLLTIDSTALDQLFALCFGGESGGFLLLDGQGTPLYTGGTLGYEAREQLLTALPSAGSGTLWACTLEDGHYLGMYMNMPGDLTLTAVLPEARVLGASLIMQRNLVILSLLVSGAGLILALSLAARNYQPIRRLSALAQQGQTEDWGREDEFARIQHALNKTSQLSRTLDNQKRLLRGNLILRLVSGGLKDEDEILALCAACEIQMKSEIHTVALAQPTSPCGPQACEALCHQAGTLYPDLYAAYTPVDAMVILICAGDEAQTERLILHLEKLGDVRLRAGIGRSVQKLNSLDRSYIEAHTALETLRAPHGIQCFGSLKPPSVNALFNWTAESRLSHCLKLGDGELAAELIEELMNSENASSFIAGRVVRYKIADRLLDTLNSLTERFPDDPELGRASEALSCAISIGDGKSFTESAIECARAICATANAGASRRQDELCGQVMAFIQQNFGDSSLSLESVASHFGYSTTYWSRFFKEKMDANFLDLIWTLRMDRARMLLCETNCTIKEISAQVGCMDSGSFIRKFKAFEGITPGQYRQIHAPEPRLMENGRLEP